MHFSHLVIRIFIHLHVVVFLKCIHWSLGKIRQLQAQRKSAHAHQRTFRIIITLTATACKFD